MKARHLVFFLLYTPAGLAHASSTLPPLTISDTSPAMSGIVQEQTSTTTSVITSDDIRRGQMTRLEDALQSTPGLTLGRSGSYGNASQLMLRGVGARNTRVFVDGVEISDTSRAQSQFYISAMDMEEIESIEVLRGPQPGRFGADTGGGVVNITTKRATTEFSGRTSLETGSYKTRRGSSMISGLSGPVDYRLSVQGENRAGYSDYNKRRGGKERDGYRQWGGAARLGLQANDHARIDTFVRYSREDQFYDWGTQDVYDNLDVASHQARIAGTLKNPDIGLTHTLALSDSQTSRAIVRNYPLPDAYKGQRSRLDYIGTWSAHPSLNVQFGADAGRDSINLSAPNYSPSSPNTDTSFRKYGAFVTTGLTPLKDLDISASARTDKHARHDGQETWRFGAAYRLAPTATTFHGSYGTAWQTPSLYEYYDSCTGNRNLKPEALRGWDVGFRQDFGTNQATLNVSWFENRVKNQINWVPRPASAPGCSPFAGGYDNIDRVRAHGLETELVVKLSNTVTLRGAHTWQISENRLTGERLRKWPLHQATGSVDWTVTPALQAQASVGYRDQVSSFGQRSSEYWVTDLKLDWTLEDTLRVYGRIENALNHRYEETYGHGTPERSAYVGVTVRY